MILEDHWDEWLGELALTGVDPRRWDLHQLLSAFEVTLKRGAKDEAAWRRIRSQIYSEPDQVRRERLSDPAAAPAPDAMTLESVEAMLAAAAARDAQYGVAG